MKTDRERSETARELNRKKVCVWVGLGGGDGGRETEKSLGMEIQKNTKENRAKPKS